VAYAVEPAGSAVGAAEPAARITLVMARTVAILTSGSKRVAVFPWFLYAIAAYIRLDSRKLTTPEGAKYGEGQNAGNTLWR
jgi:hypothetical protein